MDSVYLVYSFEYIDYAMTFDWLLDASKKNGMLSICKLSGYVSGEKREFEKFFMPIDSPEALMIQFDLYEKPKCYR